ncbi:MAG: MarR family transcriptional regulator [Erysipelotrichaceae bacterium]|jgi:DNA-binding MarR family transcriptional regulator|nr:MarR family transcriptional regulator [Erysipelotrichaceae bacterium]MCI1327003.1 MarR family transcriptional regulator [Solobacterium sp.]MCH4045566.1 MarR family transcriptional regulator [Erysipelotrichaceae bacterium]MCH4122776.1 MarR family transcriptional regulator [Erysipelotrichaceae bacterium]MCI1363700.1 MarR family transcriptional regulator [Solobacterium sp.]
MNEIEKGKWEDLNPDELLRLDRQLCFPLYAAARKAVSAYTPYLKPLDLTYTQYITFMVLWEKDGLTIGEIGERLHLDNGTLTPLLKKMEKQGYITRKRDQEDERKVTIHLTKEGRDMKQKLVHVPLQVEKCAPISIEEANELYRILYKILNARVPVDCDHAK